MLRVPDEVVARFEAAMGAGGVGDAERPHLRKWFRFYLDFCAKYRVEPSAAASFPRFNTKLAGQGPGPVEASAGVSGR
ncbi:MAG: hypothetical protein WBG92_19490 [Thiohalocapsa sp.]